MIDFWIHGRPAAQSRMQARIVWPGAGKLAGIFRTSNWSPTRALEEIRKSAWVQLYELPRATEWKAHVLRYAKPHAPPAPFEGPVRVHLAFHMHRPKGHYRTKGGELTSELKPKVSKLIWHTIKPDRDNLEKAVVDALTDAAFWHDDSQVCDGRTVKQWVPTGARPGVRIVVEPFA